MSLSAKEQCLAQEMIDLKARVKAEMNRRNRNGSLVAYAGTDYDYTVDPAAGGQMLIEHVNKIVVPMNAITASGMEEQVVGDQAMAMDGIDAKLTVYEVEPMRNNATSSCSGACSGLCVGECYNNCSGCGSSCSYNCSTNCGVDGCSNCTGSCKGDCYDTCTGGCKGTCNTECTNCGTQCSNSCVNTCRGECLGGCGTATRQNI